MQHTCSYSTPRVWYPHVNIFKSHCAPCMGFCMTQVLAHLPLDFCVQCFKVVVSIEELRGVQETWTNDLVCICWHPSIWEWKYCTIHSATSMDLNCCSFLSCCSHDVWRIRRINVRIWGFFGWGSESEGKQSWTTTD